MNLHSTFLKYEKLSYIAVNRGTFRSCGSAEQKQVYLLLGTFIWITKLSGRPSDLEHGLMQKDVLEQQALRLKGAGLGELFHHAS